jgi:hypothetical protein
VLWTSVCPPIAYSPIGGSSLHFPELNCIIFPPEFPTVSSGSLWLKYVHQTVRRHVSKTVVIFIAMSTSNFTYCCIRYEWLGYRHCMFVSYGVWLCALLHELQRRRKYVSSVCLYLVRAHNVCRSPESFADRLSRESMRKAGSKRKFHCVQFAMDDWHGITVGHSLNSTLPEEGCCRKGNVKCSHVT